MSKSNEYGYVPSSPTQARGSNTGIFEVNDVFIAPQPVIEGKTFELNQTTWLWEEVVE